MAVPSFGKYRPLAELGRGGMATVYLAAHVGPGGFTKLVVVKELRPELAGELEFREMFMDEARLAARLNHPNIVQTYEVTDDDARQLIVMEYLEGQPFSNVRTRLGRDGTLALGDHVRVISDLLEGLHAAHELKDWNGAAMSVVHRDVSPHNVFVTYGGEVKVVDFGIAKAATSSQQTRTGVIKGKISYMAPEQALGRKVDRRADIFAAGIMLWEAVALRRMWKDMPDPGIIHHLGSGQIPLVRDFCADPDPLLEHACARSLAPDPEARYATAEEMRADLEAFLAKHPPRPTPRALGDLVATAFAKERDKIHKVIEEQMQKASAPVATTSASALPSIGEASEPSAASVGATSAATPKARIADMRPGEPMTASGALAVETGPRIVAPPAAPGRRTMVAIAIGVLTALLVAGGFAVVMAVRGAGTSAGAGTSTGTSAGTGTSTSTSSVGAGVGVDVGVDAGVGAGADTSGSAVAAKPTTRPTAKPTATLKATATTTKPLDIELKR